MSSGLEEEMYLTKTSFPARSSEFLPPSASHLGKRKLVVFFFFFGKSWNLRQRLLSVVFSRKIL